MRHLVAAYGLDQGGPRVSIAKAENGYMVTLSPAGAEGDDDLDLPLYGAAPPEPHQVKALRELREKMRPRVFVFAEIEQAWAAVKEFLLDGRMPKVSP